MAGRRFSGGFTMIELVTVMILIGILAVNVLPQFGNLTTFDEKAFRDAVVSAVQHGRRMAMAGRRYTCVNVNADTDIVTLRRDLRAPEAGADVDCAGDDGGPLALPSPGRGCAATNQVCAPAGVALGGSSLIFDPLGRLVTAARVVEAAALVVTVSNQPGITVSPETGYVQ